MTIVSDPPGPKGLRLLAEYRAERLSQRPMLRESLRQSRAALRAGRVGRSQAAHGAKPATGPDSTQVQSAAAEPVLAAQPVVARSASVFATLMEAAVLDEQDRTAAGSETEDISQVKQDVTEQLAPADVVDPVPPVVYVPEPLAAVPVPVAPPPHDPPLAEIGLGPGMLIRLGQLGLFTTGDLAQADSASLRASLGDISRLVDVDVWINNARQSAGYG